MNRSEQVKQALKIIGRSDMPPCEVQRIVRYTRFVARQKQVRSGRYGTVTKEQKRAADRVAKALHRLKIALGSKDLAEDARPRGLDPSDVERWWKDAEEAATTELGPPTPHDQAKRLAVKYAAELLEAHGLPIKTTRAG